MEQSSYDILLNVTQYHKTSHKGQFVYLLRFLHMKAE